MHKRNSENQEPPLLTEERGLIEDPNDENDSIKFSQLNTTSKK